MDSLQICHYVLWTIVTVAVLTHSAQVDVDTKATLLWSVFITWNAKKSQMLL